MFEGDPRVGGRTVHMYDTGPVGKDHALTVFWHHRTPQTGALPGPLRPDAERLGIRMVSHDRPSYAARHSTPQRGRDITAVAADVAVMGTSGGGPHTLACAALLPDRAALAGTWLNTVVQQALPAGPYGRIDDDLAYVGPWGFALVGCALRR